MPLNGGQSVSRCRSHKTAKGSVFTQPAGRLINTLRPPPFGVVLRNLPRWTKNRTTTAIRDGYRRAPLLEKVDGDQFISMGKEGNKRKEFAKHMPSSRMPRDRATVAVAPSKGVKGVALAQVTRSANVKQTA